MLRFHVNFGSLNACRQKFHLSFIGIIGSWNLSFPSAEGFTVSSLRKATRTFIAKQTETKLRPLLCTSSWRHRSEFHFYNAILTIQLECHWWGNKKQLRIYSDGNLCSDFFARLKIYVRDLCWGKNILRIVGSKVSARMSIEWLVFIYFFGLDEQIISKLSSGWISSVCLQFPWIIFRPLIKLFRKDEWQRLRTSFVFVRVHLGESFCAQTKVSMRQEITGTLMDKLLSTQVDWVLMRKNKFFLLESREKSEILFILKLKFKVFPLNSQTKLSSKLKPFVVKC